MVNGEENGVIFISIIGGNQWNLNKLTTRSSSSIDAGSVLGDLYSIRFVRPQTSARTVKTTTRTTTRNIRRPAVYSNIYFTAPAGNWGSSWG
jgi:hypothetical protein